MKETIETITARAILQEPLEIPVSGKIYKVAPPTLGTLIEVSKYISQLPKIDKEFIKNKEDIMQNALYLAKDSSALGDIIAIMMLGTKNLTTTETKEKRIFFGLVRKIETITTNNQTELSKAIIHELSIIEINFLFQTLVKMLGADFFLSTLDFLNEINLLKETKTITSGH